MKYRNYINFNFEYSLQRKYEIFNLDISGTVYESNHEISIMFNGEEFEVTNEEIELIEEEMKREVSRTTFNDLIEEYDDKYDEMKDEGLCLHY